jgi:hypothetical protein
MSFRNHADEAFFAVGINQGAAANSIGCVEHSMADRRMQRDLHEKNWAFLCRIVLDCARVDAFENWPNEARKLFKISSLANKNILNPS